MSIQPPPQDSAEQRRSVKQLPHCQTRKTDPKSRRKRMCPTVAAANAPNAKLATIWRFRSVRNGHNRSSTSEFDLQYASIISWPTTVLSTTRFSEAVGSGVPNTVRPKFNLRSKTSPNSSPNCLPKRLRIVLFSPPYSFEIISFPGFTIPLLTDRL
jgi:hypothetical protein